MHRTGHVLKGMRNVELENKTGITVYEPFLLPTDAHNVKKHRVIKTF